MIIFLILLLLLPDLYIWHHFLRHSHWAWQILYWVPFVSTITMMALVQTSYYQAWMFRWGMILILCFALPKLLFTLFSILGLIAGRWLPIVSQVMNGIGIMVVVVMMCIITYGIFFGWKRLTVNEVTLTFDDLPEAFDGYRIVQLSDLHVGTFEADPELITKIIDMTNAQNADMICFTGDIVNTTPEELNPFMKEFRRLHAKDGVFSVMGNHDYCMYRHYSKPTDRIAVIKDLQQREKAFGWDLLLNENRIIHRNGDSMMLAGVENSSRPPFPDYGNLKRALATTKGSSADAPFTILLSHDPTHWRREVLPESKVQLQLSGHTHSTQFKLFGWSPASLTYKEYAGLYAEGNRKLFVCTGTGGNLAFRFGVWPEIVVITLKK